MTSSYVWACLMLLLYHHLNGVSLTETMKSRPVFPRLREDVNSINETLRDLLGVMDERIEKCSSKLEKMSKCMKLPQLGHFEAETGFDGNGVLTARFSCSANYRNYGGSNTFSRCTDGHWSKVDMKCTNFKDCYYTIDYRAMYGGIVSKTRHGVTCQAWASQYPHKHSYGRPDLFVETNGIATETPSEASNYCRDPGADGYLWCYTVTSQRWDYCSVPKCE